MNSFHKYIVQDIIFQKCEEANIIQHIKLEQLTFSKRQKIFNNFSHFKANQIASECFSKMREFLV